MPYRAEISDAHDDSLERLIELGAIDIEVSHDRKIAALMPDSISPDQIETTLGITGISISAAVGRDDGSVWVLHPRPVRIGCLQIAPAHSQAERGALRLIDAAAFGTGLHPTTALCLETLQEAVQLAAPATVLDVGTGSGVLALGALMLGVPQATAIDLDDEALRVAAENARLNGLDTRLQLVHGGPETLMGTWPLVVGNVLAAPLIEMAPLLVQRLGHRGQLVLSGIRSSLEQDVDEAYRRLGVRRKRVRSRAGWVALVLQAGW